MLIVDDSPDTVEMYALGLSLAGYRPLTATNAESAIRQLKIDPPGAVVTDLHLPGMSGWSLIEELKNDPSTKHIPVIVLTGRTEPSIAASAEEFGCVTTVTKPCLPDDLVKILQRVLPTDRAVA